MAHPAEPVDPIYPGQRLGLPENGPGAVASWGRRILALVVDWLTSLLVGTVLIRTTWLDVGLDEWVTLAVFWLEVTVLTALLGGSFGQLVARISVARPDGRPLSLLTAALRTTLICLVIPPLVFNRDNRGLHDLAVDSLTQQR